VIAYVEDSEKVTVFYRRTFLPWGKAKGVPSNHPEIGASLLFSHPVVQLLLFRINEQGALRGPGELMLQRLFGDPKARGADRRPHTVNRLDDS
jgi:hypothetical protein